MKQNTQNLTLSLPVSLLRQFRVYAAEQNRSMSELIAEAITKLVADKGDSERAWKRYIERIRNAPDRGTGGKLWKREELYEEVLNERLKGWMKSRR